MTYLFWLVALFCMGLIYYIRILSRSGYFCLFWIILLKNFPFGNIAVVYYFSLRLLINGCEAAGENSRGDTFVQC